MTALYLHITVSARLQSESGAVEGQSLKGGAGIIVGIDVLPLCATRVSILYCSRPKTTLQDNARVGTRSEYF